MSGTENFNIYSDFPWVNIRIVLVETSHPGNVGAVARAMKNMLLESLYLVQPKQFPDSHAMARSSGAIDVLNNAVVCDSLAEAVSDCRLVIAASARSRTIPWPTTTAPEAAQKLIDASQQGPVALVFGREDRGLNNEELDHCHFMVQLPANPDFSSLNIAAAVQVFSYEIRKTFLAGFSQHLKPSSAEPARSSELDDDKPASSLNIKRLFNHLESTLVQVNFMPAHRTRTLMRKLMRFFYKSQITEEEVRIFRGILTELQRQSTINNDLKKQLDQPDNKQKKIEA
ncbi:MAG: RNA methyltransferase [Gammaproteobacteria bacterium]|nr:RNA methyltransferase [Gammaproteobacteria bacterium]MDX2486833.1 RNA methyltransferase [Gammaproteobacteria bacterium]